MIELVLVYCLTAEPGACVEKRQPVEEQPSMSACMFDAQQAASEYLRGHPTYQLHGFRCEKDRPREEPA